MSNAVSVAQIVSPVAGLAAAVLVGTRRRLVRRILATGAHAEDLASQVRTRGPVERWWVSRLGRAGVIGSTADGRYWINHDEWQRYRAVRRRRALVVLTVMVVLFVAWHVAAN